MKVTHVFSLVALAVVAAMVVPASASARCMAGSLSAFPEGGELPANRPMIVLRAYGEHRDAIREIDDGQLTLVSKSDSEDVSLQVVETLNSRESLTQVVLRPKQALNVGETYSLTVEYARVERRRILILGDGEAPDTASEKRVERWSWTIVEPDEDSPALTGKIKRGASTYAPLGCGPRSFVDVEATARGVEYGEFLFLADVVRKGTSDDVQRFYVEPSEDGSVRIGHGMCSGEFDLESGARYELTLWAVDLAGNRSKASQTVELVGPSPSR